MKIALLHKKGCIFYWTIMLLWYKEKLIDRTINNSREVFVEILVSYKSFKKTDCRKFSRIY